MRNAHDSSKCGKDLPQSLGGRILSFLRKEAPEEYNAKTIALLLKANPSSVRKELSRLLKQDPPVIVRAHKGFYRATVNVESLRRQIHGKPVLMHGFKFEGFCLKTNTKYLFEAISESFKSYRKRSYYRWAWEGRTVSVTLHDNGFIELWLQTSETPISFPEFQRFHAWLSGRVPDNIDDWYLVQVDTHCDIREFNVKEFRGMRLKVFKNAWLHLYQKTDDILRLEVSLVPRELRFREALDIINELVKVPTRETYERTDSEGDPAYR